jgi:hypothetical protein
MRQKKGAAYSVAGMRGYHKSNASHVETRTHIERVKGGAREFCGRKVVSKITIAVKP